MEPQDSIMHPGLPSGHEIEIKELDRNSPEYMKRVRNKNYPRWKRCLHSMAGIHVPEPEDYKYVLSEEDQWGGVKKIRKTKKTKKNKKIRKTKKNKKNKKTKENRKTKNNRKTKKTRNKKKKS